MEDVTDAPFRALCRKMGAAMVYSEFVSSDALIRMVNKSLAKLEVQNEERPVAIQIYGKIPEAMADAAKIVVEQAHRYPRHELRLPGEESGRKRRGGRFAQKCAAYA